MVEPPSSGAVQLTERLVVLVAVTLGAVGLAGAVAVVVTVPLGL